MHLLTPESKENKMQIAGVCPDVAGRQTAWLLQAASLPNGADGAATDFPGVGIEPYASGALIPERKR
jgi:hypothetical protein